MSYFLQIESQIDKVHMMVRNALSIVNFILILMLLSCSERKDKHLSKHLGHATAFAEMVAADVKPLALSEPMPSEIVDKLLPKVEEIAFEYGIEVFREKELVQTMLFPKDVSDGLEVLVFTKSEAKQAYHDLKGSIQSGKNGEAEARRFGRLLGYPDHYINQLLSKNSELKFLPDFGIQATNVFLYYSDLDQAKDFYHHTLGLEIISDYGFAATLRVAKDAWITLVDEQVGRHKSDEPKSIAMALLTDQLPEWYSYLQAKNIEIKYPYNPKIDNAHDGFVVVDPEGYLLEFETFKQHLENEILMPILKKALALPTVDKSIAAGLGFYGMVTWLYYEDLQDATRFYAETIGLRQIVDQGWAKVFYASPTGFLGLVDGRRGMRTYTEKKGSSIAFVMNDLEDWFEYVDQFKPFPLMRPELSTGRDGRYRAFVGIDPGLYELEFNSFGPHEDNQRILELLADNE